MFKYSPFPTETRWVFNGFSRLLPGVFECDPNLKDLLVAAAKEVCVDACKEQTMFATRTLSPMCYLLDNFNQPLTCMAIDFAITEDGPQLIELQSFSSVYATMLTQEFHYGHKKKLDGMTIEDRINILASELNKPKQTGCSVILDINPPGQPTAFDFDFSHRLFGVEIADPAQLQRHGDQIFLFNKEQKKPISTIWNRIVPTDLSLLEIKELKRLFNGADVSWFGHMDHFFSVSKATMPHLSASRFVPHCGFFPLSNQLQDEDNIVIKPLYSYAGNGVILSPSRADIMAATSSMMWQDKVQFSNCVEFNEQRVKGEVRVMLVFHQGDWVPICMMMRSSVHGFSSQTSALQAEIGGAAAIV